MEEPSTAARAAAMQPLSPAATRQRQIRPVSCLAPPPSGQGSLQAGRHSSSTCWRGSARASPNRCSRARSAANRAGGSGSGVSSCSSWRPGKESRRARLGSEREGSARMRRNASISSSSSSWSGLPSARRSPARRNRVCPASQRAKASLSDDSRCTISRVGRPSFTFTGAEKCRSTDRAGGASRRGNPSS